MKRRGRRALVALIALALLVPMFAAFEAHTINVRAHIENALKVTPKEMDFGVVFPQERFAGEFSVHLSDSFLEQDRVSDVYYRLVQKRKPKSPSTKLDVIFAFDVSGSMAQPLADAQAKALNMMSALSLVAPDVQFGVMSFVDYPHSYTNYYGYTNTYGVAPDYPYKLEHALDGNTAAVATAIGGLALGYGADGPQDYTRIVHEGYADGAVGWRAGAQQVVIMFGDDVPHDDDINAGVPGKVGTKSTGGDPGVDEVAMTADDLDLQTELTNMGAAGKKLYMVVYRNPVYGDPPAGDFLDYWEHWTGITGGDAVSAAAAGDIVAAIEELFFYDDLRPYLNKAKAAEADPDTEEKADLGNVWTDATGAEFRDVEDRWNLNFYVPCIVGAVGQDYVGPIAPREADYGADIWVEVTGFSYAPPS